MEYIIIFVFLFLFFVVTDLIPQLRRKDKKALWFSIPVYAAVFIANILIGLGFSLISPNDVIIRLISSIFKPK